MLRGPLCSFCNFSINVKVLPNKKFLFYFLKVVTRTEKSLGRKAGGIERGKKAIKVHGGWVGGGGRWRWDMVPGS